MRGEAGGSDQPAVGEAPDAFLACRRANSDGSLFGDGEPLSEAAVGLVLSAAELGLAVEEAAVGAADGAAVGASIAADSASGVAGQAGGEQKGQRGRKRRGGDATARNTRDGRADACLCCE